MPVTRSSSKQSLTTSEPAAAAAAAAAAPAPPKSTSKRGKKRAEPEPEPEVVTTGTTEDVKDKVEEVVEQAQAVLETGKGEDGEPESKKRKVDGDEEVGAEEGVKVNGVEGVSNGDDKSHHKVTIQVQGLLFDMDGTLIDSTPGVLATWEVYATEHGLNLDEILRTSHGRRTEDNLRLHIPSIPEDKLKDEAARFEDMILSVGRRLKEEGKRGLEVLPGVNELLGSLPEDKWAIVTSATSSYASPAIELVGIRTPRTFITAEAVTHGKPNPEPYLIGAEKLSVPIENCLIVEDAPSGLKAGLASGGKVLGVCTSHKWHEVDVHLKDEEGKRLDGGRFIVTDLTRVKAKVLENGWIELEIDESV